MYLCGVMSHYEHDPELKSKYVAIITARYTGALHFFVFFYFFGVWDGVNQTDWVPAPTFEYSIDTVYNIALALAIYCIFYIIAASCGLSRGVRTETRIYYFPWFILTGAEILALLYQIILLRMKYSYDSYTSTIIVVMIIFTIFHSYLYLKVLVNYRYLKRKQSPTIIFPQEP